MRERILTAALTVAVVAVVATGCDDPPPAPALPPVADSGNVLMEPSGQPAAAKSAGKRRPGLRNKGMRRPPRGGPRVVIRTALKALELSDEQKTELNDLASSFKPDDDAKAADKALLEALAAGMRAGKLDDALVTEKLAAAKKHAGAMRDRSHETLNKLHAMLTPEQRKALVEKMTAGPGAEPASWLAEGDFKAGRMRMNVKSNALGGLNPLMITRGLKLSPEQRKKVRALTRNRDRQAKLNKPDQGAAEARKKQTEEVMAAFATDAFDAKKIAGGGITEAMSKAMDDKIDLVRALIETLDEAQRKEAADNIERLGDRAKRTRRVRGKAGSLRK